MRYARVVDGIVVEIITPINGLPLNQVLHPDFAAQCVACNEDVEQGWAPDGESFNPPSPRVDVVTWGDIRRERDALLRASDWRILPDAPLTEEERDDWETYRADLRAIPQAFVEPADVVWPEAPAA